MALPTSPRAMPTVSRPGDKPPGWKDKPPKGAFFSVVVLCCGLAAALMPSEGGRRLSPYLDSAKIPTACMGVIGPEVTRRHKAGLGFTNEECEEMESKYLAKMVRAMHTCVPGNVVADITYGEWIAYGHWAYNTGTNSFCHSTLAKRLSAGDHAGACRAMGAWTFITVPGLGKVNCRDPAMRCGGIPKRRDLEVSMCLSALN